MTFEVPEVAVDTPKHRMATSSIKVRLARCEAERRAAARLRYEVFVEELGARGKGVDHEARTEMDAFDAHVDHLLALDGNEVVGVYRLLNSEKAHEIGRFYSEAEYDLTPLRRSGRRLLELGRSCVRADHRGGQTLYHLWQGLARYIEQHRIDVLFGVASFHGTDPHALTHPLSQLYHNHLAPEALRPISRVHVPMDMMPPDAIDRTRAVRDMPPLIKAYLRVGGMVGDGAYIDHEFNTVDICLVMDTAQLSARQRELYSRDRRIT